MSFQIDKRTRVKNITEISKGEIFYVTNDGDRNNTAPQTRKLATIVECIYKNDWGKSKYIEVKDIKTLEGPNWDEPWEIDQRNLNDSYEFYKMEKDDYPELFL